MSTATTPNTIVDALMREFEDVFREHAGLVFGTACEVTGNREDGEDVGRFRIKRFAYGLGSMTGSKPIADLTGLKGIYEFKFTLNRVEDGPTAAATGPRGTTGVGDPPKAQFEPPISKALEQQLGLRLDPGKVRSNISSWTR